MTDSTERLDFFQQTIERMYRLRRLVLVLIHVILIVGSNQFAFWLRFDGPVPPENRPYNVTLLPLLVLIRLAIFASLRLHEGVWRYASIWDLRNIVVGITTSTLAFALIVHGVLRINQYPRSVFVIDAIILLALLGGVRLARRLHAASFRTSRRRKVLIYGAGDAGELIVRDMMRNERFDVTPIGFIDDDPRKRAQRIHGVAVLGTRADVARIVERYQPDELLIAIPSASNRTLRDIVRSFQHHKLRITTLPMLHDLVEAHIAFKQTRELKVEDLLARPVIGLDPGPVLNLLQDRAVLVTGAGGSIGSELARQIAAACPADLLLLDRYENGLFTIESELSSQYSRPKIHTVIADITDSQRVDGIFRRFRPEIVFHAAAHKHVPMMEANPAEAVKNNVGGTKIVADAAIRHGAAKFVLISTDKAVSPTSVMGATKRVAEMLVGHLNQQSQTLFSVVRFGNVLGSNGSVIPTFLSQIAKGGPVTVTHPEMRRFFMLIPEAVQLVLHASTLSGSGRVFVLDMGEQVKVVDLARDLIRLSGFVPDQDVEIAFVGIRPGEKLAEELVGLDEVAEPSEMDKIYRVRSRLPLGESFPAMLQQLQSAACHGRDDDVRMQLIQITQAKLTTWLPSRTPPVGIQM